ncbi:MAG: cation-translocating P-type ATPase [Anaerolineae bacterium]|nr:cation-translocating P-type ATPase [Anaerolineae bacterium]MBT7072089.1 cation-translocating P-type ATPase [Anaerolineae bacterium]MBT7326434.1 cation-translocating P-type ATPase [Anaerolineae bacterium]
MMNWHKAKTEKLLEEFKTDATGLSSVDVQARLAKYGLNELVEKGGRTPFQIFWSQPTETMVLILIAAAIVAAALGDTKDAIAIIAIVLLFAILGFVQEYRAERAMAALKQMAVPTVKVFRDGKLSEISVRELVPGDIVQLETGNLIPADLRLLESVNLQIQEAALTGESEAVNKFVDEIDRDDLPLGDRRNMAYLGTVVTGGRGRGLVVATAMETELGRIADLLQQVGEEQTPLQRRLDRLGKMLATVGIAFAALIFVIGILRGDDLRHMLLTAVSVAVAIVPEGLPAVVTITLALGSQSMLKRQALIRKLPAVETLGSVTVICSDKTGTLTENRMTVVVLDVAEHRLDLSEEVRKGGIVRMTKTSPQETVSSIALSTIGGALCNDASILSLDDDKTFRTLGDPTEGALLVAAARLDYWKESLDQSFPRIAEVPFDSERKRMTTVHSLAKHDPDLLVGLRINGAKSLAFTKGSVDGLLEISSRVWVQGKFQEMDDNWRNRIQKANDEMAAKGMRVLGIGLRLLDDEPASVDATLESSLTFIGLFGMIDPPRPEVRDAIMNCATAGIRPVMITGDHPLTALEIARQLGINDNGRALTGIELEKLSFDELKERVEDVSVFARVSPEHKLKIVQALQERGHIVSMTGDGVNDAPALRRADIGVAMGITGTDVSKEAADLVLLDDNFATIVAAVGEGRTIYDNIRKFVRFSVAGNIGKVLVMLLAPFLGKPIPLLPLQLLWLNLLTDGLLGLGMGVEGPERDTMKRPPYSPKEDVFSRGGWWQVSWVGILIGALALGLGSYYFFNGRPEWQTMLFSFLAFAQVFQALASRSSNESLFKLGVFSNPLLAVLALVVVALQLAVLYIPFMSNFFNVAPLSAMDLLIAICVSSIVFFAMELEKVLMKNRKTGF